MVQINGRLVLQIHVETLLYSNVQIIGNGLLSKLSCQGRSNLTHRWVSRIIVSYNNEAS